VRQKVRREVLQIHLAGLLGPVPTDREPLLREYTDDVVLAQVAEDSTGAELPLLLADICRGCGGKDEGRSGAKEPRSGQTRTRGKKRRQDCVSETRRLVNTTCVWRIAIQAAAGV